MSDPSAWGAVEVHDPASWGAQVVDEKTSQEPRSTLSVMGGGLRDVIQGGAEALGTFTDPITAGINKYAGGNLETTGQLATRGMNAIGMPESLGGWSSTVNKMGGGVLAMPAMGELLPAGSAARGFFGAKGLPSWQSQPPTAAEKMLLTEREGTKGVTNEQVQGALAGQYNKAKAPFEEAYKANAGAVATTTNYQKAVSDAGVALRLDPTAQGIVSRIENVVQSAENGASDVGTLQAARSTLLGVGRSAADPNTRRIVGGLAEGLQQDIDSALLSKAARVVNKDYREQVIGPFEKVRGKLSGDPEEAWQALRTAGPSDLKRLAGAVDDQTRELIRKRAVGEIIAREEQFNALQGGTGAPVWRQMDKQGLGEFFSKEEWRGLQRLSGQVAFFKSFAGRATTALGGSLLGSHFGVSPEMGGLAGLTVDYLATTQPGRQFLYRAATQTPKELKASLATLIQSPALINAYQGQSQ